MKIRTLIKGAVAGILCCVLCGGTIQAQSSSQGQSSSENSSRNQGSASQNKSQDGQSSSKGQNTDRTQSSGQSRSGSASGAQSGSGRSGSSAQSQTGSRQSSGAKPGASAQAETGILTGTVIDAGNGTPVIGAVVELTPKFGDKPEKKYTTSAVAGKFSFRGLKYGAYSVKITFLGYKDWTRDVNLESPTRQLTARLAEKSQNIAEVVVATNALRTSQQGDTLVYNANAFKVSKDADTETLISKMPGINVGTDGKVEAQGEEVKKVLVDGKEFFGDDVTTAIKNLPAEAVAKVEVFNKLSDNAQFTGVDDGEGVKAINIVTKPNMRNGQFGRIYAGYGYEDKYIAGGNVNIFSGDSRISIIGMANNINQQNFSTEDILGVVGSGSNSGRGAGGRGGPRGGGMGNRDARNFMIGSQSGISTVKSLGVNYSDTWGKKVEAQASYFFNTSKNNARTVTDRDYYMVNDSVLMLRDTTLSHSRNFNHRFNAKIDYKINENNQIMIRPRLSFQSYKKGEESNGENLYRLIDNSESLANIFRDLTDSKSSGYNMSLFAVYRHKFGNTGRNFVIDFWGNLSKNDGRSLQDLSEEAFETSFSDRLLNQNVLSDSRSYRLNASVMYSEPLSKSSQLNIGYRLSYSYSDLDKRTDTLDFATPSEYHFNEELSNTYNNGYLTHRVGPGYRFNNPKATIVANVYFQRASMNGDQTFPVIQSPKTEASFNNVVYMGMLHYRFSKTKSLRMFLRSYTNTPSVSQLQTVPDVSSTESVSIGNRNLKPTYYNMGHFHYVASNTEKGTTFMVMGGVTQQNNYIANEVVTAKKSNTTYHIDGYGDLVVPAGKRFLRTVNMNGYWNARGGVSYGTPFKFIKSNFNVFTRISYTATPSIQDYQKSKTNTYSYNLGAVLGSNISEKVDFTFSYEGGYNQAHNSMLENKNNDYFNQVARGRFKIEVWKGITIQADATYSYYKGITDSFREDYLIMNAFIGKKFLRSQRAEVSVGMYDVFNQNKSFSRNVTDLYIENVLSNTMGRFWSINLSYNLRNFKSKKAAKSR